MAYEVKPWKAEGCSSSVKINRLTNREYFSREMNATGEGGGLNADYQAVEAVAIAANALGKIGLLYGTDFVWKTAGNGEISFDFKDTRTKNAGDIALGAAITTARTRRHFTER